jgi:hypothetical protein
VNYFVSCRRVKSLHSGGSGDIFEEVPRMDLMDMQQYLQVVKQLVNDQ